MSWRLVVLISGSGTNLQALIDATTSTPPALPARIVRVISNHKNAYGITRAHNASIPCTVHNLITNGYTRQFPHPDATSSSKAASPAARMAFDAKLASLILEDQPDIVIMAGWMHVVSPAFLKPLESAGVQMINIHPALRSEYNGTDAISRAWADHQAGKISRTGCMIHRVIAEVDMGSPLLTREVYFHHGETRESFEERFHQVEHELIVDGTRKLIQQMQATR